MKRQRSIFYMGDDADFLKELGTFAAATHKEIAIKSDLYKKGSFIKACLELQPAIVFIDFTLKDFDEKSLCDEVLLLKKTQTFKGCLLIGLFADIEQLNQKTFIFSLGFHLSFIKGTESEVLFRDSFYIGFGDNLSFPRYAKARNIQKPLEIGICSSITNLSSERLILETDIETLEGALGIDLSFFPDLKDGTFKVRTFHPCAKLYPMTSTYSLEYPFPEPWGEESSSTILKDTVETWLDLNINTLDPRYGFIKVINMNVNFTSEIEKKVPLPMFIDFIEKLETDPSFDLLVKRPDLIFYEIGNEEKSENDSDTLYRIVSSIKSIEDYYPVVVVSNSKSSGAALQKLFGYQFVTVMPNKLDMNIFSILAESFIARRAAKKIPQESYYFSPWDNRRCADVKYNFNITSLTEHEVTFVSDIEFPFFSVLHFKLPLEFYATIVPAYFKLEPAGKGYHYMAVIHGIEEDELKKLRQFVYQIIYKPIESFDQKTVASILDQFKGEKLPPMKQEMPVEELVGEKSDKIEGSQIKAITRNFNIKGKSKL